MKYIRLILVVWWLQLKMRSLSVIDCVLSLLWPLFFATSVFLMYRAGSAGPAELSGAAVGASVMGVWSAMCVPASTSLQVERRQGTLELQVAAPVPLAFLIVPVTLSMATIGLYSMIVTLAWGRFAFGIGIYVENVFGLIASVLVTVLAIGVCGFLLAVSSVRYRAAWALGAALDTPIWLICGFLVPLQLLPDWIRPISWLLAPTWGVAAIRGAESGGRFVPQLLACAGLALIYAVIGAVVARLMVESARSRATLALA